ncbi:rhodanese-like domain-containing protein [Paenibacillus eucommiae]|uniref:Rhodanese-related sulfurtransferase n=1 Tax=Paenibacillus eucommiae TaxID=1355755 RepID=A0ABS4JAN2_9BACL|nr:rhodanese-like domain-containing protein [Paenibacillus eucommiae]MBP1996888.1 rhodanese-related sulfurtransferase [Paenibacillus eucommiae]
MIKLILLALIAFLAYRFFKLMIPVRGLRVLKPLQFEEEMRRDGYMLVDVREPREFQRGYIAGAVNIPLSQLQRRIGEIPQKEPVYLYCQSGVRSKQAAAVLRRNGCIYLAHLSGGMKVWEGPMTR